MCPRLHRVTIQADVAERRSPARAEHESHRIASPCATVALSIEIRAEHSEDRDVAGARSALGLDFTSPARRSGSPRIGALAETGAAEALPAVACAHRPEVDEQIALHDVVLRV